MQRLRTRLRAGATAFPPATFALNFLTGALDSGVTFTRGSNATLVDSTGKITYAPANLLLQSQTFDNASWTKLATTVTPNATTAPDGTLTADKLVEDTSTAQHRTDQTPTSPAGAQTFSVFAKAAERAFMGLRIGTVGGGFNLSNGTTYAISGGVTATIVSAGDGWYLCSISVSSASANDPCRIGLAQNTATLAPSYTGDGTSGIFIWGAQLEPVTYQTTPGTYNPTTTAAYYGPRFDYDPVTLAAKGLLIEEQRTNILLYSEQLDNAAWIKSNATITANATTSPDGTANAEKLVENTANAQHFVLQLPSATASTAYTFTVYLKAAERTRAALIDSGGSSATSVFDLSSGAVVSTSNCTASVSSSGNGWYRCSITFTSAVGQTGVNARVFLVNTGTNTTYTGDGTSGIFVYGAQLEAGAFATSYIPTVASQVTRSADVATMTGTNFSSWYNQSEGTFVADFDKYSTTLRGGVLCAGNTATATTATGITLDGQNDGKVRAYIENAGALQLGNLTLANYTANTPIKGAVAYATNNAVGAAAGALGTVSTSVVVPTVDNFQIGAVRATTSAAVLPLNGHIRQIAYYNTRLPNATLQALTA
jgi:hypothetical protein